MIKSVCIFCGSSSTEGKKSLFNKEHKKIAEEIGKEIAKRSLEKGIKAVYFDKGKYKFHGIIKIIAESARTSGLEF